MNWMKDFEDRELAEINFARDYVLKYNHGTSGHLAYTIIAKLADRVSDLEIQLERKGVVMGNAMISGSDIIHIPSRVNPSVTLCGYKIDTWIKGINIPATCDRCIELANIMPSIDQADLQQVFLKRSDNLLVEIQKEVAIINAVNIEDVKTSFMVRNDLQSASRNIDEYMSQLHSLNSIAVGLLGTHWDEIEG